MAIAFDAIGPGVNNGGLSSYSWSHTCSGSNRIVFVALFGNNGTDTMTGVTYDGVAMTSINRTRASSGGDRWVYLFALINPPTGAKTVVVTFNANTLIGANSISYTGVKQTGQPEVNSTSDVAATPKTFSLTTITDNSWTVLMNKSSTGATAGTGSFLRDNSIAGSGYNFFDSNSDITPTGSKSMTVNTSLGGVMASMAPAVDSGPANLKSYNTNLKANIKSINTNLIANVKSLNTNI